MKKIINSIKINGQKYISHVHSEKFGLELKRQGLLIESELWKDTLKYQGIELAIVWCDLKMEIARILCGLHRNKGD